MKQKDVRWSNWLGDKGLEGSALIRAEWVTFEVVKNRRPVFWKFSDWRVGYVLGRVERKSIYQGPVVGYGCYEVFVTATWNALRCCAQLPDDIIPYVREKYSQSFDEICNKKRSLQ